MKDLFASCLVLSLTLSLVLPTASAQDLKDWEVVMKLQKFTRLVIERESGKVIGGSIYTTAYDDIKILTDDHTMITVNKTEVVRIYLAKK
jgi:hypothetical protein